MNVGLELFVNYDPEEVDSTLALITDGRYDSTWQKVELSRHQGFLLFSHPTTTKIERVFLLNESESACCKEMYLKRRACLRVRNSTEQVFIRFTLYNQLLDYTRFFSGFRQRNNAKSGRIYSTSTGQVQIGNSPYSISATTRALPCVVYRVHYHDRNGVWSTINMHLCQWLKNCAYDAFEFI